MSSDGRRPRRSVEKERFWREQLRGHASSGLSVRAWCREHEISEPSFYAWRRELAERDVLQDTKHRRAKASACTSAAGSNGFLPITLTPPAVSQIELELPSGVVIRLPAHEVTALRTVWQLLSEQPAC